MISDVTKYPQIFPDNIKYVKVLDNSSNLVDINAGINGIYFDTQAVYKTTPDGSYTVEVVSGDLKGTTMTTKLEKTWGFHGQKEGGTRADITLDLKTSGILSWMIDFIPENSITDAVSFGFDKFVQHVQ